MIEKIPIRINDNQRKNLKDRIGLNENKSDSIKGRVIIKERKIGDKKFYTVEDTSNLIVYHGRNWLMQRAFNTDMTNRTGWKSKYISWFGVGTGGQAGGGDPLVPASPTLADCVLDTPGTLNPMGSSRWVLVDGEEYMNYDSGYPKFLHDPDITYDDLCAGCLETDPIDSTSYKCDGFLIGLVKCTITASEGNQGGNDPEPEDDYQDISEAGLFVAPTTTPGSIVSGDMDIFARVCFSTIRKNKDRELQFSWYLYF